MANGDRRNNHFLTGWNTYGWARNPASEQTPPVTLPTVGGVTQRSAVVTVGFSATPVQAGRHRILYGTRSNKYFATAGVVTNAEGATATITLRDLQPATTYYLVDVVEPQPPTSDPLRGGAYREVSSAEVNFITLA